MKILTHGHLLKRLSYNHTAGDLIWNERFPNEFKPGNTSSEANCRTWNTRYANKIAGAIRKEDGYIEIKMDGKGYLAHRLCYFYYYGYFPENGVDHKDRVKDHNWILNLREASKQCNARNTGMISTNTSGVKGVCFCKDSKKTRAYIKVNNRQISLGYFKKFNDAVRARWKGEVKYGFPNCNTSSSAYNYLKQNNLI